METIEVEIRIEDIKRYKRLDRFLVGRLPDLGRAFIKQLFEQGLVTCQSQSLRPGKMPPAPTTLTICVPPPSPQKIAAENIPLDIVYEDGQLIIVNKPPGMTAHPAPGNLGGTLVNALLYHRPEIGEVGEPTRAGIVHRLDKGTSGLMVVAKRRNTHAALGKLFSVHDIHREYRCILRASRIPKSGTLEAPIGRHRRDRQKMAAGIPTGKRAVTHYEVIKYFQGFALCKMTLETGRTHQIRVHSASLLKAPILNDSVYGNPAKDKAILGHAIAAIIGDYNHPFLHARGLGFVHPATGKPLLFEADPPELFRTVIRLLEQRDG